MSSYKTWPLAHMPLADTATADQQMILVMCHHELSELTKGESSLLYKPVALAATSYPLFVSYNQT